MKDDATASQETDEERALQWYANAANIVAIPSTDVPLLGLFAREIFRLRKERDEANACAERWMAELNPAAGDSIPPDAPRAGGETPALVAADFVVRRVACHNPWRIFHAPSNREVSIPRSLTNADGNTVSYRGAACFPRKRDAVAWLRDELPSLLAMLAGPSPERASK